VAHVPDVNGVILWEEARDVRCVFVRRDGPPRFVVTIYRGPDVLQEAAFDSDIEASDFAIAAMHNPPV